MTNHQIAEVRAFNRFYTALIGVLNRKFLNSKYSLPELRVLQAIQFQEGVTAGEIIEILNIDKSYLSRILLRFENHKLISKKASKADGRIYHLYATLAGKKEFGAHNVVAHQQIKDLLSQLSKKDCNNLIACMSEITRILSKPE